MRKVELRVRPESVSRITDLSQHESDRRESEKSQCVSGQIFEILAQAAAAVEPGERPLDDPPAWQHLEPASRIGSLDDLDLELRKHTCDRLLEAWPLIAAIGEHLAQEGEP